MRTYRLLDFEFDDFDQFIAAKRDLEKIESLSYSGSSALEDADAILQQIYERKMAFESDLGSNFLDVVESNAQSFVPPIPIAVRPQPKQEKADTPKETRRKKSRRMFRAIRNTSIAVLLCFMVMMGAVLAFNVRSESMGRERFEQLRNKKEMEAINAADKPEIGGILPEYEALHEQNPDMRGWLKIEYTSVDYPVVFKPGDNDYYLSRNFDGEYDANGMLIMDKRCDPSGNGTNILIHGHNMKSGLMFGSLRKYQDAGYFADHRMIEFDTLYERRKYKVFSVFVTSLDPNSQGDFRYYDYINTDDPETYAEYVRGVKAASIYPTEETAVYGEKLLTLSTCDYSKNDGRLVVVAKQVIEE